MPLEILSLQTPTMHYGFILIVPIESKSSFTYLSKISFIIFMRVTDLSPLISTICSYIHIWFGRL